MMKIVKKLNKFFKKKNPMLILLGMLSSGGIILTSQLIVRFTNKFLFDLGNLSNQYILVILTIIFLIISILVYYDAKDIMGDHGFRFGYLLGIILVLLSIVRSFFGIGVESEF